VAEAIANGAARWSKELVLVGFAGSMMLDVWESKGFAIAPEAFADRLYEPDGTLRPRTRSGALITGPEAAAKQALNIAMRGTVLSSAGTELAVEATTLCLHSDTPGAIGIAAAVRRGLEEGGIVLRGLQAARPSS
jgi:UPF0271 protein